MKLDQQTELPEVLPLLRADVTVQKGGMDFNNKPTWVIQDKLNNRFFHLGWKEYEMFKAWQAISPQALIEQVNTKTLARIDEDNIRQMLSFLSQNCLIDQSYSALKDIYHREHNKQVNWFLWLAKNYLFFRVPLVRPNRFLDVIYPYVRFMLGKGFFIFMLFLGIVAIILTLREWDQFTNTFFSLFSLEYILLYAIALVLAKSLHEFGHALMCKKYALNVPTMGVAFLVMFPMLYTDTGESWKVNDPKDRITISIAGVMTETYIAIFALCSWLLLPDGALKSICFFLATYSLLTTYLINISPFLRFDGYHVLSDVLSMRNLQTRSFALTKWRMRELFFGFNNPPPEEFTSSRQLLLITYAIATWIYRFILFIGIAILVYYLLFKALGILLFVIEIIYFILQPIYREIKVWWKMRKDMKINKNTLFFALVLLVLIRLLFIPWQSQVRLPATLSYQTKTLYAEVPAQVVEVYVHKNQEVKKGQKLAYLDSPQLNFQLAQTQQQLTQLEWQRRNQVHFQGQLEQQSVLTTQINQLQTEINHLKKQKSKLIITAPFDGVIQSLSEDMQKNAWLKADQALMLLINKNKINLRAYVDAQNHEQLTVDQNGYFIPENIDLGSLPVTVRYIINSQASMFMSRQQHSANLSYIHEAAPLSAYHASTYGGSIAVNADASGNGNLEPQENMFLVLLTVDTRLPYQLPHVLRGNVFIDLPRKSLAQRLWQQILILWVKESGF
ncbi:MAG: biotin/lipoyl-binding protein [Proteobacteria bacterium]|nr:biotin/lipoyl-binding protein [Pseudomonadota bacterium]